MSDQQPQEQGHRNRQRNNNRRGGYQQQQEHQPRQDDDQQRRRDGARGGRGGGRGDGAPQPEDNNAKIRYQDSKRQVRRVDENEKAAAFREAEAHEQHQNERQQQQTGGRGGRGGRNSRRRGGADNNAAAARDDDDTNQQQPQQQRQPRENRRQRGGRGGGGSAEKDEYGMPLVKGKNTENFSPSHEPPSMRVVIDMNHKELKQKVGVRDVLLCPTLFTQPGDEDIYQRLVAEIEACTIPQDKLMKLWHGDSHYIADDSTGWKKQVPTFAMVIDRIRDYFKMDIKATRFNWYKDTSEWKPFHHDAAAVKPHMAKTQNFTAGVSFGCTRDAAFEEVKSKKVVSFPLENGSTYCFSRDTNILWKHGITQLPPEKQTKEGRISIIAWGWIDQEEC